MTREEWRDVRGYEGLYVVSSLGRVRSIKRSGTPGKILKPYHFKKSPYLYVRLCKGGAKTRKRLTGHILVARAFLGEKTNGQVVHHKDGNPKNNRTDNLEYCTQKKNIEQKYKVYQDQHMMEQGNTKQCVMER